MEEFETWLKGQPQETRKLIDDHISGLTSALKSEREARSKFEKSLADATRKLEEGSTLRTELEKIRGESLSLSSKTAFYEKAHASGAKNLRLAFLAAQEAGLFSEGKEIDFDVLKNDFPELFGGGAGPGPSHAGSGNRGADADKKTSMDDLIRARLNS